MLSLGITTAIFAIPSMEDKHRSTILRRLSEDGIRVMTLPDELEQKLEVLKAALASENKTAIRTALHRVVPTFREPEEVNDVQGDTVEIPEQTAVVC